MKHPYQSLIDRKVADFDYTGLLTTGNLTDVPAAARTGCRWVITHWEVRCKAGADTVDFVVASNTTERFRLQFAEGQGMITEPWLTAFDVEEPLNIEADAGAGAEDLQVNLRGFYYRDA